MRALVLTIVEPSPARRQPSAERISPARRLLALVHCAPAPIRHAADRGGGPAARSQAAPLYTPAEAPATSSRGAHSS